MLFRLSVSDSVVQNQILNRYFGSWFLIHNQKSSILNLQSSIDIPLIPERFIDLCA